MASPSTPESRAAHAQYMREWRANRAGAKQQAPRQPSCRPSRATSLGQDVGAQILAELAELRARVDQLSAPSPQVTSGKPDWWLDEEWALLLRCAEQYPVDALVSSAAAWSATPVPPPVPVAVVEPPVEVEQLQVHAPCECEEREVCEREVREDRTTTEPAVSVKRELVKREPVKVELEGVRPRKIDPGIDGNKLDRARQERMQQLREKDVSSYLCARCGHTADRLTPVAPFGKVCPECATRLKALGLRRQETAPAADHESQASTPVPQLTVEQLRERDERDQQVLGGRTCHGCRKHFPKSEVSHRSGWWYCSSCLPAEDETAFCSQCCQWTDKAGGGLSARGRFVCATCAN